MRALHIAECYFELPSDFDGSLGDALMLMANKRKQAEAYKEVYMPDISDTCDLYEYFTKNKKGKCIMEHAFIDIE